jgi:hypothetical protein|tara:strand:+ start:212 stop:349 length:138 start_codon:yes stop_codon:yes gene_type:complete
MTIILNDLVRRLEEVIGSYFTGSITIHFSEGEIKKVETVEVERSL